MADFIAANPIIVKISGLPGTLDAASIAALDAKVTAAQTAQAGAEAAEASSEAWAQSPTPPDPDDPTSKSAKTWAQVAAPLLSIFNLDRDYFLSGQRVVRGWGDNAGRLGAAITEDGTLHAKLPIVMGAGLAVTRSLATGLYTISYAPGGSALADDRDYYFKGQRVVRGWGDNAGRGSIVTLEDGTVYIPRLASPALGASFTDMVAEDDAYRFTSQEVAATSLRQIYRRTKATQTVALLTSTGNNWAPSIAGTNVCYSTDRYGAPVLMYQPEAGGAEYRVNDDGAIVCVGDSLTNGQGSTTGNDYPSRLAALTGVSTVKFAFSGQTSGYIATQWLADTSGYDQRPVVVWVGRNDTPSNTATSDDIDAAIAAVKTNTAAIVNKLKCLNKRFVVMTPINGQGSWEWNTGTAYRFFTETRDWIAATYPNNSIDIRAVLIANYDPGQANDVTDQGHDTVPRSLVDPGDSPHLNDAGYAIVAQSVADFYTTKGWLL